MSCNVAPLISEHLLSMILQVIAWYLDEIGNDIETEDELIEQKQVIEKVVDKLIYQDQVNWKTAGRGEMIEHCHWKLKQG